MPAVIRDTAGRNSSSDIDQLVLPDPGADSRPLEPSELGALLEALLLVSPEPAELQDLAEASGVSLAAVKRALDMIAGESSRGWVVVRHGSTAHLASAPRFAPVVRRFLRLDRQSKLSGASLETLALIAYRQPVTRPN